MKFVIVLIFFSLFRQINIDSITLAKKKISSKKKKK